MNDSKITPIVKPTLNEGFGPGKIPKRSFEPKKIHPDLVEEVGGRDGLEPTRFGDWEIGGKCTDF